MPYLARVGGGPWEGGISVEVRIVAGLRGQEGVGTVLVALRDACARIDHGEGSGMLSLSGADDELVQVGINVVWVASSTSQQLRRGFNFFLKTIVRNLLTWPAFIPALIEEDTTHQAGVEHVPHIDILLDLSHPIGQDPRIQTRCVFIRAQANCNTAPGSALPNNMEHTKYDITPSGILTVAGTYVAYDCFPR